MKRTRNDMHRASTPARDTACFNAANSAPAEASEKAILSAFAEHQDEINRRLKVNMEAKPIFLVAAEAFMTLPASWEWKLPVEVGNLIVNKVITLGPDEGDGLEGLKSLVIANDIVKLRHAETS